MLKFNLKLIKYNSIELIRKSIFILVAKNNTVRVGGRRFETRMRVFYEYF
jgi:hypothetical protein